MDGIQNLANAIKSAMDKRIREESRALRGTLKNGQFVSGAKSYPAISAVDVDTNGRVWAQRDNNGNAIIVGA